MRTCSSETAGHRWIWVAPIFGMLQWLKQTWIGNHTLCQATQTMVNPPVLYPLLTFQMNNWDLPGLFVHLQCRHMLPKSRELSPKIHSGGVAYLELLFVMNTPQTHQICFWVKPNSQKRNETHRYGQLILNIYAILGKMRGFKFETENGSWTIRKLK